VGRDPGRRRFLSAALAAAGGALVGGRVPALRADGEDALAAAAASGDVSGDRAVVWTRALRPSRVTVEWSTVESFAGARRLAAPAALAASDLTTRVVLSGLPAGQRVAYRVRFEPLDGSVPPPPAGGSFRTPSAARGGVSFVWGGDVAGQGWGIDPARGGFRTFDAMRAARPDLFIHSGDSVYADNPIPPEKRLDDGTVWRNVTTAAKSKVAETLGEFRGNHRYNLLDGPLRAFRAEVPWVMQWDDHEVLNNWYPGEVHTDPRYAVKDVSRLAARARRAFLEYAPIAGGAAAERIHRVIRYGPSLDVFVVDLRSYRSPNSANRQPAPARASRLLGAAQLRWLEGALAASRATWKVVACDMPIGLAIPDGDAFEAVANGDPGPPLGREHELARLLAHVRRRRIRNVVWVTADVHYAAAHHYHPDRAGFRGFDPFWEFVAGPLHAGTFLPTPLDGTFGPEVRFVSVPPDMKPNRPPSEGLQFFGRGTIAEGSETLTVTLHDREGRSLYSVDLDPAR
jgi:alkaline phosphatase D